MHPLPLLGFRHVPMRTPRPPATLCPLAPTLAQLIGVAIMLRWSPAHAAAVAT